MVVEKTVHGSRFTNSEYHARCSAVNSKTLSGDALILLSGGVMLKPGKEGAAYFTLM
jgi:hypothetical protein